MKAIIYIFCATTLVFVLEGCRGTKKNNTGSVEIAATTEKVNTTAEDIYMSLPTLDLSMEFSPDFLSKFDTYNPISETDYHRLTDISDIKSFSNGSVRVVRLPEYDGKKFILAGYIENEEWTIDVYSLSNEHNPKDRLRIYSVEEVDGGKSVITQTFKINTDYRTEVSKHLNGMLIERLTYTPTPDGIFEEMRDGKTTTVAFDSYDGMNYIVQTFIWDHNASGGLVKKDLKTETYRLDDTGNLIKLDTQ